MFQVPVLCVDRDPPPAVLSGETRLPPNQVTRIEADIGELNLDRVMQWAQEKQLGSGVLVLAKHLCGLGTDLAIEFVVRLQKQLRVVGMIAATCCCNKISGDDAKKYSEFYSLSSAVAGEPEIFSLEKIETMARCSGYRNNAQSQYARATPEMVQLAEAFEDALQAPRQRKLAHLFGRCEERRYVPSSSSLQNRVLIAGENFLCDCKRENKGGFSEAATANQATSTSVARPATDVCYCMNDRLLSMMRRRIEEEGSAWPLDFRPQGFGSAKYDYDGS